MRKPENEAARSTEPWNYVARPAPLSNDTEDSAANRRLQTLAYELTVAEARERQRIAQVLHDEIGQLLAMAQFRLAELNQSVPPDAGLGDLLEEIRLLMCQASQGTREATFELHSPVLNQLGLEAALHSLSQRLRRGSKMHVHLERPPQDLSLPHTVLSVLLRTVRELALNAQKHARASNLWISLGHDSNAVLIRVRDDGVGFDAEAATHRFSPDGGFGLVSAEAQMQAIGGWLIIDSAPGRGTTATLTLGLADAQRAAGLLRPTVPQ